MTKRKEPTLILPPGTRPPEIPPEKHKFVKHRVPVRLIADGDNHYPIHDPVVEAAKFAFARDFKPDVWVCVGDQYDMWSISRHDKEAERWAQPGGRLQEEFDSAQPYWNFVTGLAKDVHLIEGNHCKRLKTLINANLGLFGLNAFRWHTLADIPTKVQIHEYGTRITVGGIGFEHGDRIGGKFGALHASAWALSKRLGEHSVFGHTHRIDLRYRTGPDGNGGSKTYLAYNQGHGSDVKKQKYAGANPDWQHGFTAVEFWTEGGRPRFTLHSIAVINGRFFWGGKMYDGRKWQ